MTDFNDLTDSEFAELDAFLAQTPHAPDAMGLDGFLCGLLCAPQPIEVAQWWPHVMPVEHPRARALLTRRQQALQQAIQNEGWFNPLILEPDTDQPALPHSTLLQPWVSGLAYALENFTQLQDHTNPAIHLALAHVFRHLPATCTQAQEIQTTLDKEHPLDDLSTAIDALVANVMDLITLAHAYTHRS